MTTYQTSYEPTLNDALACSRLYFRHSTFSKKSLLIYSAVIAAVVIFNVTSNDPETFQQAIVGAASSFVFGAVVALVVAFSIGYVFLPIQTRMIWKRHAHLHHPVDVEWNSSQITFENKQGRMMHDWRDYKKILEDKGVLLLVQSRYCMHYIPKRALTEEQRRDILSKQAA
ncbi:UNVERIFIED_ORG: hypothetical protein J2W74_001299 [Methylorubrum zatmanii]